MKKILISNWAIITAFILVFVIFIVKPIVIHIVVKNCIEKADNRFRDRWEKTCIKNGEDKDCNLESDVADAYESFSENEKNLCAKY